MHIDSYSFGRIVIDGKTYTSDLIIHADHKIDPSWWRIEGHLLQPEDLESVFRKRPEVLVIGTGHDGVMKVPGKTVLAIKENGIEVHVAKTGEAVKLFNNLSGGKVAAALHLTC
jgi:hypothetical protein